MDTETLNYFFKFIVLIFALIVLLSLLFKLTFSVLDVKKRSLRFYGIFLDLTNIQIFSLALVTVKFLFLLYSLFFTGNNSITLIFILATTILFNLLSLRPISLLIDTLTNMFIYFIIISKDVFIDYIRNVSSEWYIVVLLAFIMLFEFMFISYTYLRELDSVLRKNKYVKKVNSTSSALNKGLFKEKALKKQIKELKSNIKEVKESNNGEKDIEVKDK